MSAKRIFYLLFLMAFASKPCLAGDTLAPQLPISSLSFELGGSGVLYSLNYERILLQGKPTLSGRIGVNPFPFVIKGFQDLGTVGALTELSLLAGHTRNFAEAGIGIAYNYFIDPNDETGFTGITLLIPHLGYRGYSKDMRTYFKVAYTPAIIISKTYVISQHGSGYTDEQIKQRVFPIFFGFSIGRTLKPQ
jgi:hypothetical protein